MQKSAYDASGPRNQRRKVTWRPAHERVTAKRLSHILNSVPHIIFTCAADGRIDFVSEQWTRLCGGQTTDLMGEGWIQSVHPQDRDEVLRRWLLAVDRAEPYENRFRLRLPSGEYRWVLIAAKPELGTDEKIERWIGTCTDIHDQVMAQHALAEKEELYRSVLEASADCIKILNPDGRLRLMNAPGLNLIEVTDFSEIEGRLWWELWPPEMQGEVRDALITASGGKTIRFSGVCPTATGKPKWWDVVMTPIEDRNGTISGILCISRDCTAEREKAEELEWASEHDSLTALPNRRAFQKRLQGAVLRAMRHRAKLGLLLVDLDHFKHVNDTLGHAAGDAMLKEFGRRLTRSVRSGDFIGRIGGDEFAIVVEDIDSGADLRFVGEKAAAALKTPVRVQGRVLCGGATLGGALFPDDAQNANDLFKLADTALYALKAQGRGGTKLFHSHMREEAQRVASQLSLARMALTEDTVRPYYQPKIDLATSQVAGYEALLRWSDPIKGIQPPDTIEEAFKDYELASKIGALMHSKVLADLGLWRRAQLHTGRVSINAAPAEFLRDDYAERLLCRIEEHDVPASSLEIEVTEHVLMASGSRFVHRALAELKQAGITVALDDFGTGHSSLSHLRDFPVDVVKIDKSFVQRMLLDGEIAAIVLAVINLARSLGMASVAEGIETQEQADTLRAAGCTLGQGYIFGTAQPAAAVTAAVSGQTHGLLSCG